MNKLHYLLLAAVALALAWLVSLGQSVATVREWRDSIAAVAAPLAERSRAAEASPAAPSAPASRSAPVEPAAAPAGTDGEAAQMPPPMLAPAVYAEALTPAAAGEAQVPHPEIVDPRARALLQPAWED